MGIKFFCLILLLAKACNTLPTSIETDFKTIDIDNFENIYTFNQQQQFTKTSLKDSTYKVQSLANFGNQPWIDAGFPLNIALFYPDNGNIVLIDNQLNILNTKQIGANTSLNISHFGRSMDGDFLVFDQTTQTIKKINLEGKIITESLRNTEISSLNAHTIYDFGNEIYLQNGENVEIVSPNLVWLKQIKNATLIRNFVKPLFWQKQQIKDLAGNIYATFIKDSLPIAVIKNKCILKNKNKLILYPI